MKHDFHVKAKKQFGQHFLTSQKAVDDIVNCLEQTTPSNSTNLPPLLSEGEFPKFVIEIGPGTGVLTKALLEKGFTVLALEIDKESVKYLQEKLAKYIEEKKLFIIEKDCLEVDFGELVEQTLSPSLSPKERGTEQQAPYYLVGNIPYYITGAIFRNSFTSKNLPKKVVYLVQKEVAERVVANNKKESILSLSIKLYGNPKKVAVVKAGSFNPPPKVDSAILEISNIQKPFVEQPSSGLSATFSKGEGPKTLIKKEKNNLKEDLFFKIIKSAFLHKRKYALSNIEKYLFQKTEEQTTPSNSANLFRQPQGLSPILSEGEFPKNEQERVVLENIHKNISEKERAEDIPLETWLKILN
jgi:16S rRNA (adenine1518-N6/adenine1519-N6)-dimethyltransferase